MQVASDPITSTLLALFDVTPSTAYVELSEDTLIVKAGNLFRESFPLNNLGRATLSSWEWYMGLGLRTDLRGTVAPITSLEKVVSIPLESEQMLFLPLLGPLGLRVPCHRLVVSLADPDSFLVTFNAGKSDSSGPSSIAIE
jgi:hypothetical protein